MISSVWQLAKNTSLLGLGVRVWCSGARVSFCPGFTPVSWAVPVRSETCNGTHANRTLTTPNLRQGALVKLGAAVTIPTSLLLTDIITTPQGPSTLA